MRKNNRLFWLFMSGAVLFLLSGRLVPGVILFLLGLWAYTGNEKDSNFHIIKMIKEDMKSYKKIVPKNGKIQATLIRLYLKRQMVSVSHPAMSPEFDNVFHQMWLSFPSENHIEKWKEVMALVEHNWPRLPNNNSELLKSLNQAQEMGDVYQQAYSQS